MPLDGIAVSAVVSELNEKLAGGRIEKIHQPEKDEIRLYIKNAKTQMRLILSANSSNPRVHLTEGTKQNPETAPVFCMLLRKHLANGRIISVAQPSFERIIDFAVETRDELGDLRVLHIICELMGRHSNIILVSDGKILDSIKRVDITVSSRRCVLPGLDYEYPPPQDKLSFKDATYDEIFEAFLSCCDKDILIEKAVVQKIGGTSPLAGREIAVRATGDDDCRLSAKNLRAVADAAKEFLEGVREPEPYVIRDTATGNAVDFAAYNVTLFGDCLEKYDSISRAMDGFYSLRDNRERMRQKSAALRKTVSNAAERCKKKLQLQQKMLAEAADAEKFRLYGDLITANLYKIKGGEEKLFLENYYEEIMPVVEIPVDAAKTPAKNAALYYSKYQKAKTTKKMVSLQLQKNIAEIEYLSSVLGTIDMAESEQDIEDIKKELASGGYIKKPAAKKREKPSMPLKFEFSGYEIYVGRNNIQNDYVTLKLGKNNDIWLHAKGIPGSHVLIKSNNTDVPENVIEAAASLAAYYSSGRESHKLSVDFTFVKNVRKPSGALPGKVVYVNYKTAYVPPKVFGRRENELSG